MTTLICKGNSEDEQESINRESHVRKLLEIPDDHRAGTILGLGCPNETLKPKKHIPREEIVHYGKFQK
ncbi:hypothetical protein [Virgibacillus sp. DJP39]|uniref:hypothetical protein n=1 Tax=Virgibacillus sp. DJP39 TaxID=3409790 RepID=UPI003BB6C52D